MFNLDLDKIKKKFIEDGLIGKCNLNELVLLERAGWREFPGAKAWHFDHPKFPGVRVEWRDTTGEVYVTCATMTEQDSTVTVQRPPHEKSSLKTEREAVVYALFIGDPSNVFPTMPKLSRDNVEKWLANIPADWNVFRQLMIEYWLPRKGYLPRSEDKMIELQHILMEIQNSVGRGVHKAVELLEEKPQNRRKP